MGFFDKLAGSSSDEKHNIEEKEEFKSVIIDTQNINEEIKNIASAKNINPAKLSFKVLKVTTAYRTKKGGEYTEVTDEDKSLFNDNDFLLNPELKIKQHLKVEIFKIQEEEARNVIPNIILSGNKSLTKVVATVKKDINVKYFTKLENSIIDNINMKKARSNILIGFRDENMYSEVKKIIANIRVKNLLDEDCIFVVCQGLDKVPAINDKIIYRYKNKVKAKDNQDRVDYSKRGFILAVSKDETIIEYIKPQQGIPGRSCQGRFLSVSEPKVANDVAITHTDNIIKKEDDDKILYIAKKSGYVNFENSTYDIADKMEIDSVDFKTTGSIETDINSDVKINVKEKDVLKDAIGTGMKVETYEIHIEGNVGSGATIKAKIAEVKGQTHKTSSINAQNVSVSVHRGKIIGKDVEIERLEGGSIIAETVKVKQAIGGDISAKNIYIEELNSNSSLKASNLIDIKKLKGNNNKLLIDPSSTQEFKNKIKDINDKIKKIDIELKPFLKILESKKRLIANSKPIVEDIKKKIIELKKRNINPPITLMSKIKEYQKIVNEYNTKLKNYKDKKHQIISLKEDLMNMQNQILSAKIVNHGIWKELNEIKFKLLSPPVELTYNTNNNEIIREITLKKVSDDKYEINRSSEYSL
ncbi:MAG: FapA family protein [Campylobacteraceae bacterium]|nr:FapA family protein [Campylobacteraceae bacterium]